MSGFSCLPSWEDTGKIWDAMEDRCFSRQELLTLLISHLMFPQMISVEVGPLTAASVALPLCFCAATPRPVQNTLQ